FFISSQVKPNVGVLWGFPEQTVREARKLGLLRKQKFRSRAQVKVAAGATERVCRKICNP
ncbi:MAG TPA: hypothetical protein PKH14_12755, partial [Syntrophorhabdus sp.]|nr:hypothetical protein [Syntrophorhabdus sp.]